MAELLIAIGTFVIFCAALPPTHTHLSGQAVTIVGKGFHADQKECGKNTVLLAGTPCAVTSCTNTRLVCTASAGSATDPKAVHPSMSGLHYRPANHT